MKHVPFLSRAFLSEPQRVRKLFAVSVNAPLYDFLWDYGPETDPSVCSVYALVVPLKVNVGSVS
jgi:hypothetical protein